MKLALVYDRINTWGGAERLLLEILNIYPDAPLYTALYAPQNAKWAKPYDIRPSYLNNIPFLRTHHQFLAPLMPRAFESLNLDQFDIIISVTSAEAKGIITKPHQLHICYLLTPTRYLWSHTHQYMGTGFKQALTLPFLSALRQWDIKASNRPDVYLTISRTITKRLAKYYHRPSYATIYPPTNTRFFNKVDSKCRSPEEKYYLCVGRLVPYKKIDLVVEAFAHISRKLIIVGSGSQLTSLRRIATPNITFIPFATDEQLRCLYQQATALICPQEEDFGIVSLEAQASGTPVIGYKKGGLAETIIPHKTGLLLQNQTASAIIDIIAEFESSTWSPSDCVKQAKKFDSQTFKTIFKNTIEELWQKHQA